MKKITPFLWFKEKGEEALGFYTKLFPNSKMGRITPLPEAPGPAGQFVADFELMGEPFMAIQGGPNPMLDSAGPISLVVPCDTQEEIDRLWEAFKDGGKEIACGWISDKYGITWQVVPSTIGELMSDPDPEKRKRVAQVVMNSMKFSIAELEAARDGI
jgi:predicted 3-demethylubiquinone-9 3-methyltransferase (glyoxalase superfamily)